MSEWYNKFMDGREEYNLDSLKLPKGEWSKVTILEDEPDVVDMFDPVRLVIKVNYEGQKWSWWWSAVSLVEEMRGIIRKMGTLKDVTVSVWRPTREEEDWQYEVEVVEE